MSEETIQQINLRALLPSPWNREIDPKTLGELTESVRQHGIIQPLIARRIGNGSDGKLELVAGERRWLVAKTVGLESVPVIVRQLSDAEAIEEQAIENLQREDLSPIEEAKKYQQLIEIYEKQGAEHGTAISKVCERTAKARSTVYERLALLKLAPAVQNIVSSGQLPASHAALLVKLPADRQGQVAQLIAPPDEKTARRLEDLEDWDVEQRGDNLVASFRDSKEIVDRALRRDKEAAAYELQAKAFRDKGLETLTFEQAYSSGKGADLVNRDDYLSDWNLYVRDAVKGLEAKQLPKFIVRPKRHNPDKPELVYRKKELIAALEKAGKKPRTFGHAGATADYKKRERKRLARERTKKAVLQKAIPLIRASAGKRNAKVPWSLFISTLVGWTANAVCRRRGWKYTYNTANKNLGEQVAKLPENQIPGLLADILIEKLSSPQNGSYQADFVTLGQFYGVDVKAIAKENAQPTAKVQTAGISAKARKRLGELMKKRWAARRKKTK